MPPCISLHVRTPPASSTGPTTPTAGGASKMDHVDTVKMMVPSPDTLH